MWDTIVDVYKRQYLYRHKQLFQLNQEHTYGAMLDAAALRGEITFATAKQEPQRKALISYLGMEEADMRIDGNVEGLPLQPDDQLMLVSDGIFHTLSTKELLDCIQPGDIQAQCHELQEGIEAKQRVHQDNYTAIVLQCRERKGS